MNFRWIIPLGLTLLAAIPGDFTSSEEFDSEIENVAKPKASRALSSRDFFDNLPNSNDESYEIADTSEENEETPEAKPKKIGKLKNFIKKRFDSKSSRSPKTQLPKTETKEDKRRSINTVEEEKSKNWLTRLTTRSRSSKSKSRSEDIPSRGSSSEKGRDKRIHNSFSAELKVSKQSPKLKKQIGWKSAEISRDSSSEEDRRYHRRAASSPETKRADSKPRKKNIGGYLSKLFPEKKRSTVGEKASRGSFVSSEEENIPQRNKRPASDIGPGSSPRGTRSGKTTSIPPLSKSKRRSLVIGDKESFDEYAASDEVEYDDRGQESGEEIKPFKPVLPPKKTLTSRRSVDDYSYISSEKSRVPPRQRGPPDTLPSGPASTTHLRIPLMPSLAKPNRNSVLIFDNNRNVTGAPSAIEDTEPKGTRPVPKPRTRYFNASTTTEIISKISQSNDNNTQKDKTRTETDEPGQGATKPKLPWKPSLPRKISNADDSTTSDRSAAASQLEDFSNNLPSTFNPLEVLEMKRKLRATRTSLVPAQ